MKHCVNILASGHQLTPASIDRNNKKKVHY